jgi:hypothetical protein
VSQQNALELGMGNPVFRNISGQRRTVLGNLLLRAIVRLQQKAQAGLCQDYMHRIGGDVVTETSPLDVARCEEVRNSLTEKCESGGRVPVGTMRHDA